MGRRKRIVIPGLPHHVTTRGNRKQKVFRDEEDYQFYWYLLKNLSQRYEAPIYTYCFMPNHTHSISVPSERESLSSLYHDLQGKFSGYFNKKYGLCGHLWECRFFSCVLDGTHLWNAVRYVEQNPVRAQLVEVSEHYPWSGAAAHCGLSKDSLLFTGFPPEGLVTDWSSWLSGDLSQEELSAIRLATQKGIPYASEEFIQEVEALLGFRFQRKRKE